MSQITIVLVGSIYPRNIGMAARAMANMGLSRLVVCEPKCDPKSDEGRQGAAGAQEVLKNAEVYKSLNDFLLHDGEGVRIGLSARDGWMRSPELLQTSLDHLKSSEAYHMDRNYFLFFGPEDHGLSMDHLQLMNLVCRLPTYGEVTSLNLSHAVLLTCFIVKEWLAGLPDFKNAKQSAVTGSKIPESKRPVYFPEKTIETWLSTLGFDLSSQKINAAKTLNRIILENAPTHDELRVLEAALQQTIRKLREK